MRIQDLPAEARCRGCGYSLQRLEVARCPECGRDFDPGVAETYRVKGVGVDWWGRFWREWVAPTAFVALFSWAVTVAAVTFVELYLIAGHNYRTYPCWAVPPLAAAWFVRRGVRRARLRGRPDPCRMSERVFNGAHWTLCALLLTVFSYQSHGGCGHGYRHGFGPVGWGYSTIGSPCNSPGIRYWNVSERWYVWYQMGE